MAEDDKERVMRVTGCSESQAQQAIDAVAEWRAKQTPAAGGEGVKTNEAIYFDFLTIEQQQIVYATYKKRRRDCERDNTISHWFLSRSYCRILFIRPLST